MKIDDTVELTRKRNSMDEALLILFTNVYNALLFENDRQVWNKFLSNLLIYKVSVVLPQQIFQYSVLNLASFCSNKIFSYDVII